MSSSSILYFWRPRNILLTIVVGNRRQLLLSLQLQNNCMVQKQTPPVSHIDVPEDWCRGFFGKHYMAGDRSTRGYLPGRRESLSQRTSREVAGVIRLLDLAPSVRVADIPCGYGRHSLALAKLGYRVTGVDIDERELSEARRAAKEQDLQVDFLKADMRDIGFNYGGKFDAVINLFFAFGFFLEERENIRAMAEFYRMLKPGGRLLIHSDVR